MSDPLIIVPAAVLLDWLLGDPRALPHPIVGIGKLISLLETLLRRLGCEGRIGGGALVLLTVSGAIATAWSIISALRQIDPLVGTAGEIILAWFCLAARSLHLESRLVATALKQDDLPTARQNLAYIVGRDTAMLDAPEVWRGTVETVAENTADGVIAPLFYLMLGGPLLALTYKAINTLDSMVGYKNERYLNFGWAAARLDDLVNWLPARITGLLLVMTAPLVGGSFGNAWRIMRRDGQNHASPNSGIPEAAVAGALRVQLGGANSYFGTIVAKPTIGDPERNLGVTTWSGAIRLMYGSEVLALFFFVATHTIWKMLS